MRVFAVTYFYSDVPGFGSIICQEGDEYYYPNIKDGYTSDFNVISLAQIKKFMPVEDECYISTGDEQIYGYYCEGKAYIGSRDDMKNMISIIVIYQHDYYARGWSA